MGQIFLMYHIFSTSFLVFLLRILITIWYEMILQAFLFAFAKSTLFSLSHWELLSARIFLWLLLSFLHRLRLSIFQLCSCTVHSRGKPRFQSRRKYLSILLTILAIHLIANTPSPWHPGWRMAHADQLLWQLYFALYKAFSCSSSQGLILLCTLCSNI